MAGELVRVAWCWEGSRFDRTLGEEITMDEALPRFAEAAAGRGRPFTILPNA